MKNGDLRKEPRNRHTLSWAVDGQTGSWAARDQPDAKKPYRYLGSSVLSVAALPPLPNGVNITSDLIKVRKIVTGEQSQHHAQGLQASLIVLAGALQILR